MSTACSWSAETLAATRGRFRDYAGIGVQQLVLMDPEEYIAYRFENGSLIENHFESMSLATGSSVPFDSDELFSRLRARLIFPAIKTTCYDNQKHNA